MKTLSALFITGLSLLAAQAAGQTIRTVDTFKMDRFVPAGNYSGIVGLNDGASFAVVDDKCATDGFAVFQIKLNPKTGAVETVAHEGSRLSGLPNRDEEGIAYNPKTHFVYIAGEKDNRILEYTCEGKTTQKSTPCLLPNGKANSGLEALCCDSTRQWLWAVEENNGRDTSAIILIGLPSLQELRRIPYPLDPSAAKPSARWHAKGVSSVLVMDSTHLLVLERELYVPKKKIGAWTHVKIYTCPVMTECGFKDRIAAQDKRLLWECRTKQNLTKRSFANYEGMCWGPTLSDGRRTILLIADSQNRYKGFLHDWLKVLLVEPDSFRK